MVILPEEIIGKLNKRILPQWRICFISAILAGLIAHFYKLTNWLPNWDSLVFRYDPQNMLCMGRWFLPVASAPSSFYDLPWLAGLMAIVLHALGTVCICRMFEVRKSVTAALIGAAVVTFPVVASVLTYNYVADAYALSFLLATVAAMLITQEKPKYTLAAVCIALSVGIYQAYITVTITLLLCHLILSLLYKDVEIKTFFLTALKFLLTGIAAMALYALALVALLKITGTALLEYQGMDQAASFAGLDIWASLYTIKEAFVGYFFGTSAGFSVFNCINVIVFVATVALYLTDAINRKLGIVKFLLVCALVVLLPIGACILSFMNSTIDYHNLMKMGFFVFYLFFILHYERSWTKFGAVKLWTILAVVCALVFNQIVIANVAYHELNMSYEKSYGVLIRVADRIEQTQEAENCDRILVLGALPGSEAYSVNLSPDMTGATNGYILRADDEIVGQSVFCSALNDYCGKNYRFVSGEEKVQVLQKVDAESMKSWPDKDFICVVDNVIVIKLGD